MTDNPADSVDPQPMVLLDVGGCVVALDRQDSRLSVSLVGQIDLDNADQVLAVLRPLIEQSPARIEIDLSGLDFIDSFGISRLIMAQQAAIDFGVELVLRNARQETRRVFIVAGLTEYLRVD